MNGYAMNTHHTDDRLEIMMGYASQILEDSMPLNDLCSIFDEILLFRNHYQEWYGEASLEYKLANYLLTFSRVFRNSKEPQAGKISVWLTKHPLHMEWFTRIKNTLDGIVNSMST